MDKFVDKVGKGSSLPPAQNFDAKTWEKNQEIRVKQVDQTMKERDANQKSQLKLRAEQIAKSNTVSKQPTPNILPTK